MPRRSRKVLGAALGGFWLIVGVLVAPPAQAELGFWDAIRDPRAPARAAARRLVLMYARELELREVLAACVTALPFADAELRFLCGARMARTHSDLKHQSLDLLRSAIEAEPESPWVGQAWYELGTVAAELGKHELVIQAFSRALDHLWQRQDRARAHYNRALAYMARGDLVYASSDYRRVLLITEEPALYRLGQFGLGVALERGGDLRSGLLAFQSGARIQLTAPAAQSMAPRLATAALIPGYEEHYYSALGAMAAAEVATDPKEAEKAYEKAILEWEAYIQKGRRVSARYLDHAEANRSRSLQRLAALKRRGIAPPAR